MAIREELFNAYRKEFGIQHLRPIEDDRMKAIHAVPTNGSITEEQARKCLESALVLPLDEQVWRYSRHGLGGINLRLSGVPQEFLIDTNKFLDAQYAWFKGIRERSLGILISSGQQDTIKKRTRYPEEEAKNWFVEFPPETIEGLLITLHYPARSGSKRPVDYKAEIIPLSL